MGDNILFALWFFVPAGIANATPILVSKTPFLRNWRTPIDCNLTFHGKRLLGDHKTWRGLVCGLLTGTLLVWLQVLVYRHSEWIVHISRPIIYTHLPIIGFGVLISFGVLAGDAIESLCKRQLGVPSGHSWFPFDQLDYIIGGLALGSLIIHLSLVHYIWVVFVWFSMHLLFSYIGYLLKFKDRPI